MEVQALSILLSLLSLVSVVVMVVVFIVWSGALLQAAVGLSRASIFFSRIAADGFWSAKHSIGIPILVCSNTNCFPFPLKQSPINAPHLSAVSIIIFHVLRVPSFFVVAVR